MRWCEDKSRSKIWRVCSEPTTVSDPSVRGSPNIRRTTNKQNPKAKKTRAIFPRVKPERDTQKQNEITNYGQPDALPTQHQQSTTNIISIMVVAIKISNVPSGRKKEDQIAGTQHHTPKRANTYERSRKYRHLRQRGEKDAQKGNQ